MSIIIKSQIIEEVNNSFTLHDYPFKLIKTRRGKPACHTIALAVTSRKMHTCNFKILSEDDKRGISFIGQEWIEFINTLSEKQETPEFMKEEDPTPTEEEETFLKQHMIIYNDEQSKLKIKKGMLLWEDLSKLLVFLKTMFSLLTTCARNSRLRLIE